ncbi:hypothetical protein HDU76_005074 [Blyttiomyces sp. JEL0837]|nr:hypothetical protein HDU76_005074 [Blyttiomyces sp. JEL0837]
MSRALKGKGKQTVLAASSTSGLAAQGDISSSTTSSEVHFSRFVPGEVVWIAGATDDDAINSNLKEMDDFVISDGPRSSPQNVVQQASSSSTMQDSLSKKHNIRLREESVTPVMYPSPIPNQPSQPQSAGPSTTINSHQIATNAMNAGLNSNADTPVMTQSRPLPLTKKPILPKVNVTTNANNTVNPPNTQRTPSPNKSPNKRTRQGQKDYREQQPQQQPQPPQPEQIYRPYQKINIADNHILNSWAFKQQTRQSIQNAKDDINRIQDDVGYQMLVLKSQTGLLSNEEQKIYMDMCNRISVYLDIVNNGIHRIKVLDEDVKDFRWMRDVWGLEREVELRGNGGSKGSEEVEEDEVVGSPSKKNKYNITHVLPPVSIDIMKKSTDASTTSAFQHVAKHPSNASTCTTRSNPSGGHTHQTVSDTVPVDLSQSQKLPVYQQSGPVYTKPTHHGRDNIHSTMVAPSAEEASGTESIKEHGPISVTQSIIQHAIQQAAKAAAGTFVKRGLVDAATSTKGAAEGATTDAVSEATGTVSAIF